MSYNLSFSSSIYLPLVPRPLATFPSLFQEVFEVRLAKMPEEPPPEVKDSEDTSGDEESGTDGDDETSSGVDSESEAKRANQLSYLHEQVRDYYKEEGLVFCSTF